MYTYAQAETILARLYGADEQAQRNAFRGRLKHLKRVGIPMNMSPGRGKKVLYTREHLFQWAICLEFSEFGIDPMLTSKFIYALWNQFRYFMTYTTQNDNYEDDVILTMYPIIMSKNWTEIDKQSLFRRSFPDFYDFKPGQISDTPRMMQGLLGNCRRAMVINITEVLRLIDSESRRLGVEPDILAGRTQPVGDALQKPL